MTSRQRKPLRKPRTRAWASGRTNANPRSAADRPRIRDTAIMALVALAFIAAFGIALSMGRPTTSAGFAASRPHASALETISQRSSDPALTARAQEASDFSCEDVSVTDGDTIRCGPLRVRLASIDSPEMPGHCRQGRQCVDGDPHASKLHLEELIGQGEVLCRQTDTDRYGRIVALCSVAGRDLSCAQVEGGFAIIRYGELMCAR